MKPPFLAANLLLEALPPPSRGRLRPLLSPVSLARGETLHEPGAPVSHVYFPLTAVVSVVTRMVNGDTIESATIGNEGMVGIPVFLSAGATVEAFVQIPGDALRMDARQLLLHAGRDPGLDRLLSAYTAVFIRFMSQSSACNRVHTLRERCARWLLTADNRSEGDTFPLTHQFLGEMMGVRRASVTDTMNGFRRRELLAYRRGIIRILDRERLEGVSCECYRTIKEAFEELVGPKVDLTRSGEPSGKPCESRSSRFKTSPP
ncbi:MAG: Crp/Fnr family transcriptional regulator [Acidobacteriota bacterium]|nr:Crp/Fnr family transcriptional regulator [Acidobacteriota bacterium]